MTLVQSETATYEAMWGVEDYAKTSPGEQLVSAFRDMSGATPTAYADSGLFAHLAGKGLAHRLTANRQHVLDAGCGSGKGAVSLSKAGFAVTMADLTETGLVEEAKELPFYKTCLWEPIKPQVGRTFDYVYCCDVLEHVPMPFTMLVISRLMEVAHRGVFLSIAMQGDNFGVWIGKPLHQTVMNFVQWRDFLSALGHVKECRDMLTNGLYYVERR